MGHFPEDERPVEMMGDADEATEPGTAEGEPAESPTVDGPEPAVGEGPEPPAIAAVIGEATEERDSDGDAVDRDPIADRPAATVDGGPIRLEAVAGLGDRLSRQLDAIQAILEREARAEATRERVIDRLHAELQEYKQDLLLKVQRPIFVDLIQLHDDIGKMIEARSASDAEPDRAAALRGILESIQIAIEDILYRQGVEPFTAEGDPFDPRRQRAVATAPTDDPVRNKTIAARLRKGFQAGDKLIRPEIVSVYTLRPPPDPPA
jgi:molecular chaperone GrpE